MHVVECKRVPNVKFPLSSGCFTLPPFMQDNIHGVSLIWKDHLNVCVQGFYWGSFILWRHDWLIDWYTPWSSLGAHLIMPMSHLIRYGLRDSPWIIKTLLLFGKFQRFKGYLPGSRDKGQTSPWAWANSLLQWVYPFSILNKNIIYNGRDNES